MTPPALSISRARATGRSGSARTTKSRPSHATRRPTRSTSRPRSTASKRVVDWPVERVERSWAGLRTFAPDRLPVYGFDVRAPGLLLVRRAGRVWNPDLARRGEAGGRVASWPSRPIRRLRISTRRISRRRDSPEMRGWGRRVQCLPPPTTQGNERVGDGAINIRTFTRPSELLLIKAGDGCADRRPRHRRARRPGRFPDGRYGLSPNAIRRGAERRPRPAPATAPHS